MKEAPLNFEIFKRIQAVTHTRTQTALAEILRSGNRAFPTPKTAIRAGGLVYDAL